MSFDVYIFWTWAQNSDFFERLNQTFYNAWIIKKVVREIKKRLYFNSTSSWTCQHLISKRFFSQKVHPANIVGLLPWVNAQDTTSRHPCVWCRKWNLLFYKKVTKTLKKFECHSSQNIIAIRGCKKCSSNFLLNFWLSQQLLKYGLWDFLKLSRNYLSRVL